MSCCWDIDTEFDAKGLRGATPAMGWHIGNNNTTELGIEKVIDTKAAGRIAHIATVFNNLGQKVYTAQISSNGGTETFHINTKTHFPKGIYQLQINDSETTITKKLVIQ